MKKVYKAKLNVFFWVLLGSFIISPAVIFLANLNFLMPFFLIACFFFIFYFLFKFTHRIELDYDSREIAKKVFGISVRKIKIDNIEEYYLEKYSPSPVVDFKTWLLESQTRINLKLATKNGESVSKELIWNIDINDAQILFAEVAKLNMDARQVSAPFYYKGINRPLGTRSIIIISVVAITLFVLFFWHILTK